MTDDCSREDTDDDWCQRYQTSAESLGGTLRVRGQGTAICNLSRNQSGQVAHVRLLSCEILSDKEILAVILGLLGYSASFGSRSRPE